MPASPPTAASSAWGLAALLAGAGTLHLARPRLYDGLIPRALGRPRPWVLGSGIAELACAAALAVPRTRRRGALATAALLVAVLPGNVTMAVRARGRVAPVVAWARVPLQVPLVAWALHAAGLTGGPPHRTA